MSDHFQTWAFSGPSIDELQEALTRTLGIVFEARYGEARGGDYWGTPIGAIPSIGVYPNAEDEDGCIHVPGHPEVTAVVDGGELTDDQFRAIQSLGGRPIEEYRS